jgi:hypothetical protein
MQNATISRTTKNTLLNESIDQNQRQLEGYLKELEELASRISELVSIVRAAE